jgi:CubicO group peptidase (beta-lactamase class C family)
MQQFVVTALVMLYAAGALAADPAALPRSTPEEQGISSAAILSFIEAADHDIHSLNSFILVRHGNVVAEGWWAPYSAETPHSLYSLSKSFTSTAIGMAIAEGKISLDDEVLKFFPELAPAEPGPNLKQMRIRDLLCMSAGHDKEVQLREVKEQTKAFLAHPVAFKPGTHFLYNTPASYMLSAILQKVNGEKTVDYLRPRLFEPLAIANPVWEESPEGVTQGGYGLSVRTEDIAKFGQLYLQKGEWNGKQLIPADWVERATSRQTSNGSSPKSDWDQGYGYQFWRCRNGCFRGDGAFGQYCIVMPEQDAVIAITSGLGDMQSVMNLVWDKLLPAMQSGPIAANAESQAKLQKTLAGLTLPPQKGSVAKGSAAKLAGKTFEFPANDQKLESIALSEKDGGTELTFRSGEKEQTIAVGDGQWKSGKIGYGRFAEQPVAASGGWTADDTYTFKLCFYQTPFTLTGTLKLQGDEVAYDSEMNVNFGPSKLPQMIGRSK